MEIDKLAPGRKGYSFIVILVTRRDCPHLWCTWVFGAGSVFNRLVFEEGAIGSGARLRRIQECISGGKGNSHI
ncbi:hypothetical protein SAY87_011215 [Trapa incisa]|uniref:Uncharacterized protein n=1 Tax=Trapa incisa TaxID=236973 RepID=A0AAN7GQJ0_9MYRT|nr:hypothetical protein SAY87_011215 [Trapa incisa]